jgi:hypothetical protein
MKNILILLVPILIISLYGGCGDSNNCAFLEYEENLANSECLAEDFIDMKLLRGCSIGIGCNGMDTSIFNFDTCTVIDCETLECENIFFEGEPFTGFMAELENDMTNILPTGVFVIEEMEIPFECLFFVP